MSDFILEGEGISFGDITVRLARSDDEIIRAQRLRYHIFYEEFHAKPSENVAIEKRDCDEFDDHADHLIVLDTSIIDPEKALVGTYRMLREDKAQDAGHATVIKQPVRQWRQPAGGLRLRPLSVLFRHYRLVMLGPGGDLHHRGVARRPRPVTEAVLSPLMWELHYLPAQQRVLPQGRSSML